MDQSISQDESLFMFFDSFPHEHRTHTETHSVSCPFRASSAAFIPRPATREALASPVYSGGRWLTLWWHDWSVMSMKVERLATYPTARPRP